MPRPQHPVTATMAKRQNVSERIEAINLLDLEIKARELLPQTAYDYFASGANDEITLRENRVAYERIALLPRMLVDVSERHMGTTALGEPVSMPILVAATAFQGLAHPEGEVATVKAAGAAKTLMTVSTISTFSIEEVMAVATGPVWFQLYGTDVLKAIACGARAAFIGRPVLSGLASGAEAGVRYVPEMVRQEFDLAMALSGCPTLSSITRDLIRPL